MRDKLNVKVTALPSKHIFFLGCEKYYKIRQTMRADSDDVLQLKWD